MLPVNELMTEQIESRISEDDECLQEDEEEHEENVDPLRHVIARRVRGHLEELDQLQHQVDESSGAENYRTDPDGETSMALKYQIKNSNKWKHLLSANLKQKC